MLWLLVAINALAAAQNASTNEIVPLLRAGRLVPQVVPSFNATIGPLVITYPQAIVNYGNNISLAAATSSPEVQFVGESAFPDAQYTLAMIDPDAPTPQSPTSAQIRHWLVSDISPSPDAQNLSMLGSVLSNYRSPAPPAGSDAHRYSFFLLRQTPNANVSLFNQTSVSMFNLTSFILQNELSIVSGNYFNASRSGSATTASASSATNNLPSRTATSTNTGSRPDRSLIKATSAVLLLLVMCF